MGLHYDPAPQLPNAVLPRKLQERSYLKFEFPQPTGANKTDTVYLPFYENISIKESKKANYSTYNPLGRSSSLFAYTGAKARDLSLSFNLTLDHLRSYQLSWEQFALKSSANKESEKARFKSNITTANFSMVGNYSDNRRVYVRALSDDIDAFIKSSPGSEETLADKYKKLPSAENRKSFSSTVDIITFWINILRSSVINNSKNPSLGPPIIRLTHGILYQHIPCICSDYSIEAVERGGYDNVTLLPRILKISLKLQEVRGDNFGDYTPRFTNAEASRDNLPGWESVLEAPYTLDPHDFNTMDLESISDATTKAKVAAGNLATGLLGFKNLF